MKSYKEITDKLGRVTAIQTKLQGRELLNYPEIYKGTATPPEERVAFGLLGHIPNHVVTLQEQVERLYEQYQAEESDLEKNLFLNALKQRNETLFYKLASEHLAEMLPVVYTPTIADAVETYSHKFNRPAGLYLSYPERDQIDHIISEIADEDIELFLVTDGEGVLGIGDWGIGGINICVGKLMVYTLCAGINPRRVKAVQLDAGTNNEALLADPGYLGWRHERVTGEDYDQFIDTVVTAIQKYFPQAFFHWEDFGRDNARKNLNRFRDKMCTFNDDIQGTGATALATMLSGLVASDQKLEDQRIVFLGAGTAGCGVADQMCNAMVQAGLSREEAQQRFWMVDRQGLLTDDMNDLLFFQKPYARHRDELSDWDLKNAEKIELYDVVKNVKPTVLVGCSTVRGAFTEDIVKMMADAHEHPIILPLSNPTSHEEATPSDLLKWTEGRVLMAFGSPFDDVHYRGKTYKISQCNNAFIFPGLGLGILASKASRVTDGMIAAACHALSHCSPALEDKSNPLLPNIADAPKLSRRIALDVAEQARKEGVAMLDDQVDLAERIDAIFWEAEYLPFQRG